MSKKYTYEEFLEIIRVLRSENGCPWDREQTHKSLRPCMVEEAAEVLAAIRILDKTGDADNLREELGDVLLQVVMHARIAEEEGLFTMEDVVSEVAEKMIRRHPHVFGTAAADDSVQALQNWEEVKKKEKEGKSDVTSPLREIPIELPALARAPKVLKKVDKLYEPQADFKEATDALLAAAARLCGCTEESREEKIAALTGDALMALSRISGICKLPQEQILSDRVDELIERFEKE